MALMLVMRCPLVAAMHQWMWAPCHHASIWAQCNVSASCSGKGKAAVKDAPRQPTIEDNLGEQPVRGCNGCPCPADGIQGDRGIIAGAVYQPGRASGAWL